MKLITSFALLVLTCSICKAQSDTTKSSTPPHPYKISKSEAITEIHTSIFPDLEKKIATIPFNSDKSSIKEFISDNNNPVTIGAFTYTYKIDFNNDKDVLKVKVKINDWDGSSSFESAQYKYETYLSYICEDPTHSPKHNASTLDEMKKIQQLNKCSSFTVKVVEVPNH